MAPPPLGSRSSLDASGHGPLDRLLKRTSMGSSASACTQAARLAAEGGELAQRRHHAAGVVPVWDRGEISSYTSTGLGTWLELGRTLVKQAERAKMADAEGFEEDVGTYVDVIEGVALTGVSLPQVTPGYEALIAMLRKHGGAPIGHRAFAALRHLHRLQPPTALKSELEGHVVIDKRAWAPVDAGERAEGCLGFNAKDDAALLAEEEDNVMEMLGGAASRGKVQYGRGARGAAAAAEAGTRSKGRSVSDEWQTLCDTVRVVRTWVDTWEKPGYFRAYVPGARRGTPSPSPGARRGTKRPRRGAGPVSILDEELDDDDDVGCEGGDRPATPTDDPGAKLPMVDHEHLKTAMRILSRVVGRLLWLSHATRVLHDDLACRASVAARRRADAGGGPAGRAAAEHVLSSSFWRRLASAAESFTIGASSLDAVFEDLVDVIVLTSGVEVAGEFARASETHAKCDEALKAGAAPATVESVRAFATLLLEYAHAKAFAHDVITDLLGMLMESYALDESVARFDRFGGGSGAMSRSAAIMRKNYRQKWDKALVGAIIHRVQSLATDVADGDDSSVVGTPSGRMPRGAVVLPHTPRTLARCTAWAMNGLRTPQLRIRVGIAAIMRHATKAAAKDCAPTIFEALARSAAGGGEGEPPDSIIALLDHMCEGVALADLLNYAAAERGALSRALGSADVLDALLASVVEAHCVLWLHRGGGTVAASAALAALPHRVGMLSSAAAALVSLLALRAAA